MEKQVRKIIVQSEGSPVVGHIPVEHSRSPKSVDSTTVQREQITVAPFTHSEPGSSPSFDDWADYFAPSIERWLPSTEHTFVPEVVSVERETIYRDQEQDGRDEGSTPRRVRITRRRVTMVGTVQHA